MAEDAMRAPARQAPEGPGSRSSPAQVRSVIAQAFGAGAPLDPIARRFFEPKFDASFGEVRVHTGQPAARSADALGASAYTDGRDLVFGPRQYAPGSDSGRRLLGHELAHVAQYQHGRLSGGDRLHLKAKAIRFQDEPVLDDVSDGTKVLKEGDSGEPVIRIATALAELGKHGSAATAATFDAPLTASVTSYQDDKGLKDAVPAGQVEKQTFDALDTDFSGLKVERDVIGKQTVDDLLKGTQTVSDEGRTASERAISTKVKAASVAGVMVAPVFKPEIEGKGSYKDRLTAIVEEAVLDEYEMYGKDKAEDHGKPEKLYAWPQVEIIAKAAQKAVDGLFGKYYSATPRAPLKQNVNIFDAFDDKILQLTTGGKAKEDWSANWRVEKIITSEDAVTALDEEHGADQTLDPEAAIIAQVQAGLVAKHRAKLIETHKGWPGYADEGKIFIQRFIGADAKENRYNMWDFFQTFIHEYIHTVEHPDSVTYREGKDDKEGGMTLREGVTDYLTKIVWQSITIDNALRQLIEGPFYEADDPFEVQELTTYSESANAERLAGVVGIRNVLAAFLLGKVELIGKP